MPIIRSEANWPTFSGARRIEFNEAVYQETGGVDGSFEESTIPVIWACSTCLIGNFLICDWPMDIDCKAKSVIDVRRFPHKVTKFKVRLENWYDQLSNGLKFLSRV